VSAANFDIGPYLDSSFISSLVGPQGPPGKSSPDMVNGLKVVTITDSEAANNTLYYSINHQTLIYKDNRGELFRFFLESVGF